VSKRRVACFDIDGTLHRGTRLGHSLGECVARTCVERGLAPADSFRRADELFEAYDQRRCSFERYSSAFTKRLEDGFFGGMREADVCAIAEEIAKREEKRTYAFTRELLKVVQELGYCTIAISGSFYGVSVPFAKAWGFEHVYGTEVHADENGEYYSEPEHAVVHARDKGGLLRTLVEKYELTLEHSIAIGDALSDASMLEVVEHPILFNPDEKLLTNFQSLGLRNPLLIIERRVIYASHARPVDYEDSRSRERAVDLPPDVAEALSRHDIHQFVLR